MGKQRTLNELEVGEVGTIEDVLGNDDVSLRLMEMGLIEGARIERMGQAPLGDPLEFAIQGTRMSLRIAEASKVILAD